MRLLASVLGAPLAVQSPMARADAIVVLGASLTRDGALSEVLEERVRAGVDLLRRGLAPVMCMTGGGTPGRVEAEAMARRAIELGVRGDAILIEPTARNTHENAVRVAEMLFPGAAVWIVTQPFHLRRSLGEFERAGLRPRGWRIQPSVQDADPRRALRWIAREYVALSWMRRL